MLISLVIGFPLGVTIGVSTGYVANALNVTAIEIIIISLVFLGGVIFIWLLPIENKFYFLKIKNENFLPSNINYKYRLAPISFLILLGCVVGEKHYYNVISYKHCLLPVLCPEKFCIFQYCFNLI